MTKKPLTEEHKNRMLPTNCETLSLHELVETIKSSCSGKHISSTCSCGLPYFGRVTLCIHNGSITHVENAEIIK